MAEKFFVILGNQLFDPKILDNIGCNHVFMAEDFNLCTYQKHHKLKIYLFLCSMREYKDELKSKGIHVSYNELQNSNATKDYAKLLIDYVKEKNIDEINFFEIEDKFFEEYIIKELEKESLKILFHPSPMFMFTRDEFETINGRKNIFRLANFYKVGRKKFNILVDQDLEPVGGKWSFDEENRKKIPDKTIIPRLLKPKLSKYHSSITKLIEDFFPHHNGNLKNVWFPVKRKDVEMHLNKFLEERFLNFGVYEDAMREGENFLFHSCISPFLNIGLITPDSVIKKILQLYNKKTIPLNSVEGYIRQILGWREFIRGIYQLKSDEQENKNFWKHNRYLCESWYDGSTGIIPLDDCIKSAINDGYSHHIPRLMVISNLMNMCEINPKDIYKWFMEMYIDSSDWVMVPNVFGMATFSDGGLMSTKPYTCSSNYILKMSNYKKGPWCEIVDGLYWRFIDKHRSFYKSNPRLSFQIKMLDKMDVNRKSKIFDRAEYFLLNNTLLTS